MRALVSEMKYGPRIAAVLAVLICAIGLFEGGRTQAQSALPAMGVINDTTLAALNTDWPPGSMRAGQQALTTSDGRQYFVSGGIWVQDTAGIAAVAASVTFPALTLLLPCQTQTITVPGALVGMPVVISPNVTGFPASAQPQPPWVSATNTVSYTACAPIALASFTVPVVVKVLLP